MILQTIRSYQRTRLKSTGSIDGEKVLTKHLLNGQMGDDYMSDSQQEMDVALNTISEEFKEEHEKQVSDTVKAIILIRLF